LGAGDEDPTAWVDRLEETQRKRLLGTLCADLAAAASCLPWLPEANADDVANNVVTNIKHPNRAADLPPKLTPYVAALSLALNAYAAASPVARIRHAAILSALIQHAKPHNLAALTRLAVDSGMDAAWAAVVQVLRANPWSAVHVVAATPWNDLHVDVQTTMLSAADHNNVCAAIAYARGVRDQSPPTTGMTARAFFAAVTPEVWTALPMEKKRTWHDELDMLDASLAVRSLGLDPIFLEHARLNADMIAAVRRHAPNEETLRWTLLPMAVRDLPIVADVSDVVAALPAPPDPVAFVQIACAEQWEIPPALRDWIVTHPAPHACRTAVMVLRAVHDYDPIARCTALMHALAGWSAEEINALLTALPKNACAVLHFNTNVLANAPAHPDRQDTFRQALDALDALPPSVAIPARHALGALAQTAWQLGRRYAGEIPATVLRSHGRIFADIVGALADAVRSAVLPGWDDPHVESALDHLAAADPLVAHYLSHALHANDSIAAYNALTAASLEETRRIWQSLPNALQQSVLGDRDALLTDAAAPGRVDDLAQALHERSGDDGLLPLLALRMLIDDDKAQRARGAALLVQWINLAISLLPLLRDDLRVWLETDPRIAVACADLPPPHPSKPVRRQRSQAR